MDRILSNTLIAFISMTILVVVLFLFFDRPIAEAASTLKGTGWHTMAKQLSLLASASFINLLLAIGFVVAAIDCLNNGLTRRSKSILYICTSVSAAIVVGDVLKDIFGRARPPLLFDKGIYGLFPLTGEYLYYSFPSGHTLRIFSAMTALGILLPRLRIQALSLALLVGASRVLALKHYPSDVLFGAFIGTVAAIWGWKILYPYGRRD